MHAGTDPNHLPCLWMRVVEVSAGLRRRHGDPRLRSPLSTSHRRNCNMCFRDLLLKHACETISTYV
jgi:hypothetical protein